MGNLLPLAGLCQPRGPAGRLINLGLAHRPAPSWAKLDVGSPALGGRGWGLGRGVPSAYTFCWSLLVTLSE